jgi:hypothetical protein
MCSSSHLNLQGQQSSQAPPNLPRISNNEYTDNYSDKSIISFLSLFCKSDLPQIVLQIFSSSVCLAGLLCINSYSHSSLLQLVLLFYSAFSLALLFCSTFHFTLHIYFLSYHASSSVFFLTVSFLSSPEQPDRHSLFHLLLYT